MGEINLRLEEALREAASGSRQAAIVFFEEFLKGPLYVPERYQMHPLSDAPDYPDDLMDILGVQGDEYAFVPVFTGPAYIEDWCGNPLTHRSLSGTRLLEVMPEDWWITLNPGSEFGKELSDWELAQLRGGPESIPSVVSENFAFSQRDTLDVQPIEEQAYPELFQALRDTAKGKPQVLAVFILKERDRVGEDEEVESFLLGIQLREPNSEEAQRAVDELRAIAQTRLIGAGDVKVLVGTEVDSGVALSVFRNLKPVFSVDQRRSKLGGFFRGLLHRSPSS